MSIPILAVIIGAISTILIAIVTFAFKKPKFGSALLNVVIGSFVFAYILSNVYFMGKMDSYREIDPNYERDTTKNNTSNVIVSDTTISTDSLRKQAKKLEEGRAILYCKLETSEMTVKLMSDSIDKSTTFERVIYIILGIFLVIQYALKLYIKHLEKESSTTS